MRSHGSRGRPYRVPGGQEVGLQVSRGSRGRPTGSQGVDENDAHKDSALHYKLGASLKLIRFTLPHMFALIHSQF